MKFAVKESSSRGGADLFIVGCFAKEGLDKKAAGLEPGLAGLAQKAVKAGRFSGRFGETLVHYGGNGSKQAAETILFGLGNRGNFKPLCARKAAGQITRIVRERKALRVRILLETFSAGEVTTEKAAAAFAETSILASYDFDKYKSPKTDRREAVLEFLASGRAQTLNKTITRSRVIAESVLFTRNLINEPANVMNAPELARLARQMAARRSIACRIVGEAELKRLKMGGILGVNQGSPVPPALIVLEYGKRFQAKGTVCLVGKGVTFDTGGLSIKPSKGMEKMKYDMSGAAGVLGAIRAIAELKLPVHVVALAPAVENNVANNPMRPGDIIRMYSGKTVEVLNTDAEGRLILADALAYSAKFKPKAIIDMATLTGMCAATFADQAIGLMGNDEKLLAKIKEAGLATGERCWELPTWDEYGEQIKGKQSDLQNIGGPYGGTITAAMFLKEFVPAKTAWAHLDIAGTAWCDSPRFDCSYGATGVGVRLLTEFVSRL